MKKLCQSKQYACDHIMEDPKTLGSHWDAAIDYIMIACFGQDLENPPNNLNINPPNELT